jgi:hypothetical protein
MPKFEVRMRSQTDEQSRLVTLSAESEEEARARCVLAEREVVDYTLDGDEYLTDDEKQQIVDTVRVDDDGKMIGADKRGRGKLHQHLQKKLYVVEAVRRVPINTDRLVAELVGLSHDPDAWSEILEDLKARGVPLAAVTALIYGVPVKNQYDGTAVNDWDTDTQKIALLTGYTANQDTHDFFDDVSGTEITGTGYTAGGATLASKTATYDTASDQIRLDAADPSWTTSTLSATDAVIYKSTGTASTSPLLVGIDFGGTVATTAGTFAITFDSLGVFVLDVT